MRQIRDRPGSARNQRTTSGTEAMFLSVTVQLCASSSGSAGALTDIPRQVRERFAHGVKIAFALNASDGIAMPAGLRHVDVDRDLAEPAFDHESFEKFGMLEQCLSVGHEHGHEPNAHGMAHDFDQLTLTAGAPIRVSHIATGDLQSAPGPLEPTVGVDLLLHLGERGNRHLVGVFRQVTMSAMKGTIARTGRETAVGEMAAGQLVGRAQLARQRVPALAEESLLLAVDRKTESVPPGAPSGQKSGATSLVTFSGRLRECELARAKIQLDLLRRPENAGPMVVEFSFPARDHDGGQAIADQVHAGATHVH